MGAMKLVRTSGSLRRAVDKIIHLARIFVHRDLVYDHLKSSARAAKAFDKAASCRRGRRSESVLSVSRALYAFPSSIGLLTPGEVVGALFIAVGMSICG
jgi:hypothetical protein